MGDGWHMCKWCLDDECDDGAIDPFKYADSVEDSAEYLCPQDPRLEIMILSSTISSSCVVCLRPTVIVKRCGHLIATPRYM